MTVVLPRPVELPDPPGSADALGDVLDQLATAGFAAGLSVHLLAPAAVLTGWQGADATAAAVEVGAATAVAADLHEALTVARARLVDHHELWLAVRSRVAGLRDDQRRQYAEAAARLGAPTAIPLEMGGSAVSPEALALVDAVAADDADRAAEHGALLQVLAENAAGAAAVLGAAARPFGGSGRPGSAAAVTARLAVQLPGWGAGALATLGAQAADDLLRPGDPDALSAAVERWQPYASLPGFADALVGRIGADGLTWLLSVLSRLAGTGEEKPLAALLASALGGAGDLPSGRVGEVLSAVRLDPDDPDGAVDGLAVAMGLVMAAPGVGPGLAATWGRQLLAREAVQGARAGATATGGALLPDAVEAALAVLARSGDAAAAARLLDEPQIWTTLLSRPWPDGGTGSLAEVIGLAAEAPEAGRAARSALLTLGQGLAPGSTGRVLDDRMALTGVRDAVTGLVAGQPGVVLPVLDAAANGAELDEDNDTALRGLGYLVADDASAREVTAAVRAALRAGDAGEFAGQVAGAHVAVLEYGQRLQYALAWSHEQSRAVDADMVWTFGVSLPVALVPGSAGELAGMVEGVLADVLDTNGDVEIGPDVGEVRTDGDAARLAVATLGPAAAPGAQADIGAAARVGFDRAGAALGRLTAPTESLLAMLADLPLPDQSARPRRGG